MPDRIPQQRLHLTEEETKKVIKIAKEWGIATTDRTSDTTIINRLLREIADGHAVLINKNELQQMELASLELKQKITNPIEQLHATVEQLPALVRCAVQEEVNARFQRLIDPPSTEIHAPKDKAPELH